MKIHSQEINLSILTEEARKEIVDFYLFLVKKYGKIQVRKTKKFEKMISNPLRVKNLVIPSREQLNED